MELGPFGGLEIYKKRREQFFEKIKGGAALFVANTDFIRNDDAHHPYRQDSTLFYLTGFYEQETILLMSNIDGKKSTTLFVRPKDPTREMWDGFRYGIDGALKYFGVDRVLPVDDFKRQSVDLLKGADRLFYRLGENKDFDSCVIELLGKLRSSYGRSGRGLLDVIDGKSIVGELRLFKSDDELKFLRKAAEISVEGHVAAMKAVKPGMWEYEIQAVTEKRFRELGSERLGYNSIIATGANATVLHYVFNNAKIQNSDLILMDAGAEYGYMSGDITRCFPASGKFSAGHKKVYEAVLKVQKSCVAKAKPGETMASLHKHAIEGLTEAMIELGLLKGSKESNIESKSYVKYYPHGTGHYLGMDVHDAGLYQIGGEPRKLEPRMSFTVEPGLYITADDMNAPAELRGIGVRIEDDVVITATGCENLTTKAPKEISEIEALMGG